MSKLQEIKDKFETKTVAGHEVEILAYKEDQEYSIIGIVKCSTQSGWITQIWDAKGSTGRQSNDLALTPKKKHLPKDILCEVRRRGSNNHRYRYSDGIGGFYVGGSSSKTGSETATWDNYKVLEQEPKPWFNDAPSPIPEGLKYRVFIAGCWWSGYSEAIGATSWRGSNNPITAYQILGATNEA